MSSLINWYPGHIAKAQNTLKEQVKLCDFVLELVDARLPLGSRFDVTNQLVGTHKPRILVFTKSDMADPVATQAWLRRYRSEGHTVVSLNAQTGSGLQGLMKAMAIENEKVRVKMAGRGRLPRASRAMVVGLPNVGKSSLINKLAKKRRVKVGDKPGVTRQVSWIRLAIGLDLMDTPGIIPPRFEDQVLALKLAMVGAVSTEAYDPIMIVPEVLAMLASEAPHLLEPYDEPTLLGIARKRGTIGPGGAPDLERAARTFMGDLRQGTLGPLTLDRAGGFSYEADNAPIELDELFPVLEEAPEDAEEAVDMGSAEGAEATTGEAARAAHPSEG